MRYVSAILSSREYVSHILPPICRNIHCIAGTYISSTQFFPRRPNRVACYRTPVKANVSCVFPIRVRKGLFAQVRDNSTGNKREVLTERKKTLFGNKLRCYKLYTAQCKQILQKVSQLSFCAVIKWH